MQKPDYEHTQTGWVIIVAMVAVAVLYAAVTVGVPGTPKGLPWLALAFVAVALVFGSLTVRIQDGILECRFGIGLIWRRIPMDKIERAEAVRNKWYYGWGIRLAPHGWLWNVSGLDAVELTMTGGKRFRIGTDEPERLVSAVREAMERGSAHRRGI